MYMNQAAMPPTAGHVPETLILKTSGLCASLIDNQTSTTQPQTTQLNPKQTPNQLTMHMHPPRTLHKPTKASSVASVACGAAT
jgi:hypothetical protein